MHVNTLLSGNPTLVIKLSKNLYEYTDIHNIKLIECASVGRDKNKKHISLIPPHGNIKLMVYDLKIKEITPPIYVYCVADIKERLINYTICKILFK